MVCVCKRRWKEGEFLTGKGSVWIWERWRRGLSVGMILLLFGAGLFYCNKLFANKQSIQKYEQFFQTDKEFDVLFVGSSHVINGVSPLDLFRDYGISSFNLSMHGNYVKSGYFLLKAALERLEKEGRHLPEMVVLDVYADGEGIGNLHNAWDSFALSGTKKEMIRELAEEKNNMELMMPFSLYHSRWSELKKNDFEPNINLLYGVELRYGVTYPGKEIVTDAKDKKPIEEEKLSYVNKIKTLCESYGIALVLIHIPYSYSPDWQREANSFYEYANENHLCFVNYMNEEMGLDFDIDFFDQGHLNPVGMRQMTREMGELLGSLGVKDRRQEPVAEAWKKEYEEFIDYRVKRLKDITQAKIYLMSLHDPDLISVVQVKRKLLEDVQIAKLIERLKDGKNEVMIVEEGEKLLPSDGKEGEYDLYCVVHKKETIDSVADSGGFVWEEGVNRGK